MISHLLPISNCFQPYISMRWLLINYNPTHVTYWRNLVIWFRAVQFQATSMMTQIFAVQWSGPWRIWPITLKKLINPLKTDQLVGLNFCWSSSAQSVLAFSLLEIYDTKIFVLSQICTCSEIGPFLQRGRGRSFCVVNYVYWLADS
jgi:hypothetical protein